MIGAKLYDQHEAYKLGFIAGLYDAMPDEGKRFGDPILDNFHDESSKNMFLIGYRDGLWRRRGSAAFERATASIAA